MLYILLFLACLVVAYILSAILFSLIFMAFCIVVEFILDLVNLIFNQNNV